MPPCRIRSSFTGRSTTAVVSRPTCTTSTARASGSCTSTGTSDNTHMALDEKLSRLPDRPGVYIYKDAKSQVIYVGKAASLRSRVRSYFQESRPHDPKTDSLVRQIADLEYIVTDNELEALMLEANLVRKHRPRYNIILRDDK